MISATPRGSGTTQLRAGQAISGERLFWGLIHRGRRRMAWRISDCTNPVSVAKASCGALRKSAWSAAKPVRYPEDDFVVAVATDAPHGLPVPTQLPVLDLNAPAQVVDWLLQHADRFDYQWDLHGDLLPCAPQ